MLKTIIICLLIVLLTLFLVACNYANDPLPHGIQNLLSNSNMEGSNFGKLSGWFMGSGGENHEFEWSTEESYSPDHSVKIQLSEKDEGAIGVLSQYIRHYIPRGREVTLKAKLRLDNIEGEGIMIALKGSGNDGITSTFVSTQGRTLITGTSDWKEYSVAVDKFTYNDDIIVVFIIYGANTTGTVYIDDVELLYEI